MRLKNLPKKFEGCWTYSVWSCWASFFEKHVLFYRRSQSSALHWSRLNWPISSEHNHPFFQPHFGFRVGRSYDLDVSQKNGLTFFILEKRKKLFLTKWFLFSNWTFWRKICIFYSYVNFWKSTDPWKFEKNYDLAWFNPKNLPKNFFQKIKNPFYKVWHVWRSSNLLEPNDSPWFLSPSARNFFWC